MRGVFAAIISLERDGGRARGPLLEFLHALIVRVRRPETGVRFRREAFEPIYLVLARENLGRVVVVLVRIKKEEEHKRRRGDDVNHRRDDAGEDVPRHELFRLPAVRRLSSHGLDERDREEGVQQRAYVIRERENREPVLPLVLRAQERPVRVRVVTHVAVRLHDLLEHGDPGRFVRGVQGVRCAIYPRGHTLRGRVIQIECPAARRANADEVISRFEVDVLPRRDVRRGVHGVVAVPPAASIGRERAGFVGILGLGREDTLPYPSAATISDPPPVAFHAFPNLLPTARFVKSIESSETGR
eukprot:31073-Pelagococcus_subviridis.AAC.18